MNSCFLPCLYDLGLVSPSHLIYSRPFWICLIHFLLVTNLSIQFAPIFLTKKLSYSFCGHSSVLSAWFCMFHVNFFWFKWYIHFLVMSITLELQTVAVLHQKPWAFQEHDSFFFTYLRLANFISHIEISYHINVLIWSI